MNRMMLVWLVAVFLNGSALAAFQDEGALPPRAQEVAESGPGGEIDVGAIERQLQSPNEAERQRAVAAIALLVQEQPEVVAAQMSKWIKPLMNAREYEWVDRAGLIAILHRPQVTSLVSDVQAARVEALLALGRHEDALSEAKRYYNVAAMPKSSAAIDLMAQALQHAREQQQPGVVTRFRRQQVMGAEQATDTQAAAAGPGLPYHYRPTAQADPAGSAESVFRSIVLDDSDFAEAIQIRQESDSYENLIARGNLLLLADRPAEAKECFREAAERESTRGKELVAALEGVARAIRAEDGAVGRANAFILALRQEQ
jgi:hypothetical protein